MKGAFLFSQCILPILTVLKKFTHDTFGVYPESGHTLILIVAIVLLACFFGQRGRRQG